MSGRDLLDVGVSRQAPRQPEALAQGDELVDAEMRVGWIEQHLEGHERATRVRDDHDRVAFVLEHELDAAGDASTDVRRLNGFVEDDGQIAEPLDEEAVEHPASGEILDDRDGDAPQQVVTRQDDRAQAADEPAHGLGAERP